MFKGFFKKAVCIIIFVITVFLSAFCVSASEEYPDGHITVDKVSALNGDSVLVKLIMEENPGIMAMTISITYDSSALEFEKYYQGYPRDYTVADHPDKNLIRFVNCEKNDNNNNGNMIVLKFKVRDDADFGFYPISVDYKSGDFCNWKLEKLMPEITAGGVEIEYNGTNCRHKKYGEWEVMAEPACIEKGAKQRVCEKCGHIDTADIPSIGHDFAKEWTVDRKATAESSGIMSRHCNRCEETIDTLTFTLDIAEENKVENTIGTVIKPSELTDELVKEQLPEVYESNGGTSTPPDNKNDNSGSEGNTIIPDEIIDEIKENGAESIGKIFESIPNLKKLGFIFIIGLILLLRFIHI